MHNNHSKHTINSKQRHLSNSTLHDHAQDIKKLIN